MLSNNTSFCTYITRLGLVCVLLLFMLPLTTDAAWFNYSYDYRVPIQIVPSKVGTSSAITNFPVYVDLANLPAGFWSNVQSDGDDIRVVEGDEITETAFELVAISTASSTGELYFLADSLSTTSTSTFYIYYGNDAASAYASTSAYGSQNVWGSNYLSVYHLNQDPSGTVIDSQGYRDWNANVSLTSDDLVSGKIGNGIKRDNGVTEYLRNATGISVPASSNFTMQLWMYQTGGAGTNPGIWRSADTSNGTNFMIQNSSRRPFVRLNGSNILAPGGSGYQAPLDVWNMQHWTIATNTSAKLYVNGTEQHSATHAINTPAFSIMNFGMQITTEYVVGTYDELRFLQTDLSPAWIWTEFNNQSTTTEFYSVGAVQIPNLLSGTLYVDAGSTPAPAGVSLSIVIGTSTPSIHSTTTGSAGAWTVGNVPNSNITSSTPMVIFIDASTTDVTTLVTGYSGETIANIPIYYNTAIAYGATATSTVDLSLFTTYDRDDDSDILFVTATTASSTTILADFINAQGTFKARSDATVLTGSFTNNGTFDDNGGVLRLTGSSEVLAGTLTGSSDLGNVTVTGSYSVTPASASTSALVIKPGGSFTAPGTRLSNTGGFTNLGTFSDNSGELVIEGLSANSLQYLVGRDSSGSATGTAALNANTSLVVGNYLYVGKAANATACSQSAGAAIGCELLIFDISSTTNPVYVAGRDTSGNSDGTGNTGIESLLVIGNTLYVGKDLTNAGACTSAAGSAASCSLMVFDISSTTNPVFLRGLDPAGSTGGTYNGGALVMAVVGSHLLTAGGSVTTACTQTAGTSAGCELKVFDISSTTNPVYVAGRDSSGSSDGTLGPGINSMSISGNYLYIGKVIDATACNQTAGSGDGCEVMVFDISSTTNPVYVAGRDSSGTSNGTIGPSVTAVVVGDGVLYIGKAQDVTACTQTAGSADGCELMVFDIASATNPVFVTGLDSSGSSNGTIGPAIDNLRLVSNVLYVGKGIDGTACTQTAGSADGCELMVFDVSSSTNPIFTLGIDSSGSRDGTAGPTITSSMINGDVMYLTKGADASACSQTAGSGDGCELMMLSVSALPTGGALAGTLTGSSDIGTAVIKNGTVKFFNSATTTNLTVSSNATMTAPAFLSVSGDYVNNGVATFDRKASLLAFLGTTQTLSGALSGTSALPNVYFGGSGTKTVSSSASTTNLTIGSGVTFNAPTTLTVAGNLTNNGTYNDDTALEIKGYLAAYLAGQDSTTGSGSVNLNGFALSGTTLYVGKAGNNGTCSSTVRTGCELMVFNVMDPSNPVYVNGIDSVNAGNGSNDFQSVIASGTTLYISKASNAGTCSATDRTGCELQVYNISSSTNPTYVNGKSANTGLYTAAAISGKTLYVSKLGDFNTCSDSDSTGCEIMVFDISSTTNPTYVAGRDPAADAGALVVPSAFAVHGSILYVTKFASAVDCPGVLERYGCELIVYDISSTTNPVYINGVDSVAVSGNDSFNYLVPYGTALYVGKTGNSGTCSATDRTGCELMVFDISSTTNPVYINGLDSTSGAGSDNNTFLAASGTTLYVGKAGNSGTCSATDRTGCELMVFDISSTTNPVYVDGRDSDTGIGISQIYYFVLSSSTLYASKAGNTSETCTSTDHTGCELVVFDRRADPAGTLTGSSALGNVSTAGSVGFLNNASTTNLANTGTLLAPSYLTVAGNYSNSGTFTAGTGTTTLNGVAQQTATGTLSGTSAFRNLEVANTFGTGVTTQALVFGAPLETTGTFTMRASTSAQFLANATNTFAAVHWNGGGATTPVYLRSTQTETQWRFSTPQFISAAYINVRDSYHASTTAVPCTEGTCVNAGNNTNWGFVVENTGLLTLANHPEGQVENQFSLQNKTDAPLFRFSLTAATETAIMDEVVFTLTGVRQVDDTNLQDLALYEDVNSDGVLDGGDTAVLGAGTLVLSGETGTITFNTGTTSVATTTTTHYLLIGTTYSIDNNTYATFRLTTDGLSAVGGTNYLPITMAGSADSVQHIRGNAGGSGINRSPIGGDGPAGAGQQGGGEQGGGGGAGEENDGENMSNDPDFYAPSSNGDPHNEWTNPGNAYDSDGVYATAASTGLRQAYGGFGFNIPSSNIIQGIVVKLDASGSTAAGTLQIGLSWDGGATVTTLEATPTLSGSDVVYEVGGQSNLWGRSWTATELNNTNFRVRVIAQPNSNTTRLDALEVRVYHTAGGGGGGGGGEI